MGSARTVAPPWGGDKRVCDRVTRHVVSVLKARNNTLKDGTVVTHDVAVIDPIEVFGPGGAFENDGALSMPHHFLPAAAKTAAMNALAEQIKACANPVQEPTNG